MTSLEHYLWGIRTMKRGIKIMLVALLILIIAVPSILIWSSVTQTFLFSSDLPITDFVRSGFGDAYAANGTDSGRDIAHVYVRIENAQPNSNRMPILFSIWHTQDTELDSLSLRFSTEPYVTSLFLEASTYDWPGLEFHQDGLDIVFSAKDLGWYGEGTITLNFILDPDPHSNALSLTTDFSMHYYGFMPLTALRAHSFLNTQLP